MKSIKEQIDDLSNQIQTLQKQIVALQQECPHPTFIHGLTMIACIAPVLICDDCGFAKPMPLESASNDFNNHLEWDVTN